MAIADPIQPHQLLAIAGLQLVELGRDQEGLLLLQTTTVRIRGATMLGITTTLQLLFVELFLLLCTDRWRLDQCGYVALYGVLRFEGARYGFQISAARR